MKFETINELTLFIDNLVNASNKILLKSFDVNLTVDSDSLDELITFFSKYEIEFEERNLFSTIHAKLNGYNIKINIISESENKLTEEEMEYLKANKIDFQLYSEGKTQIFNFNKLVDEHQLISMRKHTRFIDFPMHKHDYIELIYVRKGKLINYVSGKEIIMQQGDIFLMNQEVFHSVGKTTYDDEVYNFLIHPDYFKVLIRLLREDKLVSKFLIKALDYYNRNIAEYVYFKYNNNEENTLLFEKLIKLFENYEQCQGKIKIVVGYILCNLIEDKNSYEIVHYNNFEEGVITVIKSYIVQNYKDASLEELANQLNMKTYQLSKMIKKEFGETFVSMVKNEKMYNAAKLLESTDLTMEYISHYVGYSSVSHFFKQFKTFYGVTPSEYRLNNAI